LLTNVNILVVEDNAVNQKIMNFMLNKLGATVTSALDGEAAVDLLKEQGFNIVLMDLQMPGMNGFETARYIRKELSNNVPIIALTADLFVAESGECMEAGMNACIVKPVDTADLEKIILSVIKTNNQLSLNNPV
jgi:CheY-like chemotaxis protein